MITGNTIAIVGTARHTDEAQAAAIVLRGATYRAHCFTLRPQAHDGCRTIADAASAIGCDILVTLLPSVRDAQCAAQAFALATGEDGRSVQGWIHCAPVTMDEEDVLRAVASTFPLALAAVQPGAQTPADWRPVLKALGPRLLPFVNPDQADRYPNAAYKASSMEDW